jgi:hypothetical protein
VDGDGDGLADAIDSCPNDAANDADKDGVCGDVDRCPGFDDTVDTDNDGLANGCDSCPNDAANDADSDGVCGDVDRCPGFDDVSDVDCDGLYNDDEINIYGTDPLNADTDGDGIADGDEVAYWGSDWDANFDGDDLINLLDADADGDGYTDGEEITLGYDPSSFLSRPALPIEAGVVSVDHNWIHVSFKLFFHDPIVVAKLASFNSSDPAVVRIRNVDANGFEIRIQEWDYLDGYHTYETVSYSAMERGSYTLDNGTVIEAGKFLSGAVSVFDEVSFTRSFNVVPVVTASVTSFNESDAVTGRLRNISSTGFEYMLQEQESNTLSHAIETISYIAWEPSIGMVNGMEYEVTRIDDSQTHEWQTIVFQEPYSVIPVFLADMQSTDGSDTASLRYDIRDTLTADLMIEEETSKDMEVNHITETVGYILVVY